MLNDIAQFVRASELFPTQSQFRLTIIVVYDLDDYTRGVYIAWAMGMRREKNNPRSNIILFASLCV